MDECIDQYEIFSIETLDGDAAATAVNVPSIFYGNHHTTSSEQCNSLITGTSSNNTFSYIPTLPKFICLKSICYHHQVPNSHPSTKYFDFHTNLNSYTFLINSGDGLMERLPTKEDEQKQNHDDNVEDIYNYQQHEIFEKGDSYYDGENKLNLNQDDDIHRNEFEKLDLLVNIKLKKKQTLNDSHQQTKCSPFSSTTSFLKMFYCYGQNNLFISSVISKKTLFPLILLLSIIALVLLHNGSLNTRKTPTPKKFFTSNNPFVAEFEFGQLKELWGRLIQNEIAFIMFYAPWDSDCIRARNEIEVVANHYGQQIFFGAINCWWPEGECRKYHSLKRFPHFVAHIRSEGEIEYKGPVLASYIIPFLDNVMNPLIPIKNEGELLDLRAQYDAVVLGYFDYNKASNQPGGYRSYLTTSIKALENDPWRTVVYTVVTNSRVALKLKIDPQKKPSSLIIYVGNTTEHFTAKFLKPFTLLSWIYSRSSLANTIRWMNPSGIKSSLIADYIHKTPTFILFTPRSFLLGISPYYDLIREIVLDYYNCDNSPIIRSLIHRNILRRKLLEERLSEFEERCHELLDSNEETLQYEKTLTKTKFHDNVDTCCHTQTVKWRSFGGARHGITKKCLCTSCVHIFLPKCPARCQNFDCFLTASRYLDEFDPNYVNISAVYCNQIKITYQPKYTPYYKIVTTCSGNLQELHSENGNELWKNKYNTLTTDEKISRMIQEFETQHCRKLKLGMNYTDLNFPDTSENRKQNSRANFTGLACRTNRTLKFMSFDSLLYQAFAESLGIDVFNVPHSTITLIIDPTKESVHVLNHEILFEELEVKNMESKNTLNVLTNSYTKNAFIEFIKNFTDGKLPRFLRNQMPLSSGFCDFKQMITENRSTRTNIICVPELNTVTFVNLVLGKSLDDKNINTNVNYAKFLEKDIIVMYYAPWCGFCSSIAHIYLDVARFFEFSDDIIFARINGDANDLPWEYTVDRYPTIIFFPARKRSDSVTYPSNKAIDQSGLFKFILNHAQLSVKIRMSVILCQHSCLKRSYISNYFHLHTTSREINHMLNSLILFKDIIKEINLKISATKCRKELEQLKIKKNRMQRHLTYIRVSLRKLRDKQQKQNLLNYFILLKIQNLLKSNSDYGKLSGQLNSLLHKTKLSNYGRKVVAKNLDKITMLDIDAKLKPIPSLPKNKIKRNNIKDEL